MSVRVAIRYALLAIHLAWMPMEAEADTTQDEGRRRVLRVARSLVGQKEIGHNRGPFVEKILAGVGLPPGQPWCAAFNFYCFEQAGYGSLVPKSGWSPDWLKNGKRRDYAYPADVFGVFFRSKGRVAHTGIVESQSGPWVVTIEGNTSSPDSADSREGDGCYRKKRSIRTVILKTYL